MRGAWSGFWELCMGVPSRFWCLPGLTLCSSIQSTWGCVNLHVSTSAKREENSLVRVFMGTPWVCQKHWLCAECIFFVWLISEDAFYWKYPGKVTPFNRINNLVEWENNVLVQLQFFRGNWSRKIRKSESSDGLEQIITLLNLDLNDFFVDLQSCF